MNDTDLVVRSGNDAKVIRLQDARDQVHNGPIIKQYLPEETAENLLILCGIRSRPAYLVVVLGEDGRHWILEAIPDTSQAETERGRVIWRRLWVPPLPDGEEGR